MINFKPFKSTYLFLFLLMNFQLFSCHQPEKKKITKPEIKKIITGAERTDLYVHLLKNKNVAVVGNQTSIIKNKHQKNTHIVDSLLSLNINIKKVFAPEHGFRGKVDAGEVVKDGKDTKTGLPIISLYGKNKKPSAAQLKNIDVVVFDIQDVGVRFYTYISSLHYVMEACAELKIPVILLDRPNPNGHYIDGPVLEPAHTSFVGLHKVPVVYGMTIGEYGTMINGEQWLKNKVHCNLKVIPLQNYTHTSTYNLPVKPSPNLPNSKSINLYPSLCFFEGTNVSVGRGTNLQFQIVGSPYHRLKKYNYSFTPKPNEGAKYPKHNAKTCYGYNLSKENKLDKLELKWLLDFYQEHKKSPIKKSFFKSNGFFTKLTGTTKLQQQIEQGLTEEAIRKTWQKDITNFKQIRSKYLRY